MQREERRVLGLVILRGEEIVSLVLEGPPPAEEQQPLNVKNAAPGTGLAKAVGRGMAMPGPAGPAAGLAGPARGVGGPAPGMMLPRPQVCIF
jgi:small nuclear ribonucleoprotein B and B'